MITKLCAKHKDKYKIQSEEYKNNNPSATDKDLLVYMITQRDSEPVGEACPDCRILSAPVDTTKSK